MKAGYQRGRSVARRAPVWHADTTWPTLNQHRFDVLCLLGLSWWATWCLLHIFSSQTRDVEPMLGWCWPIIVDGGPTSTQHWLNASCLMGEATRTKADTWHNLRTSLTYQGPQHLSGDSHRLIPSQNTSQIGWQRVPTNSLENSDTYHKKTAEKTPERWGRSHTWQIKGVKSETCGGLLANAGSTLGQSYMHWPDLKQPFFLVHVRGWRPGKTNMMSAEVDCRLGKMQPEQRWRDYCQYVTWCTFPQHNIWTKPIFIISQYSFHVFLATKI